MRKIHWNITKCKSYKEFWILDYYKESDIPTDFTFSFLDKDIFDFRNEGIIKTKYFKTEIEAAEFRDSLLIKGESNLSEIEKIEL